MMWRDWIAMLLGVGVLGAATWLWRYRAYRTSHLQSLASQRPDLLRDTSICIIADDVHRPATEFAQQRITRIEHFVSTDCLHILRSEAVSQIPAMKRTFIPLHKKGAALSYEQIHTLAPHCLAFYHDPEVQRWVSAITGVSVCCTPDQDQSSLSILCYHEPGDHINWHYDHNFYRGRHFTVLLSLVNEAVAGPASHGHRRTDAALRSSTQAISPALSQGTFQRQLPGGKTQDFETSPNTLVIFEGAKIRHRATPIGDNERRVMLSMTYCADPRISRVKEVIRRVKDTAFFGLQALWD